MLTIEIDYVVRLICEICIVHSLRLEWGTRLWTVVCYGHESQVIRVTTDVIKYSINGSNMFCTSFSEVNIDHRLLLAWPYCEFDDPIMICASFVKANSQNMLSSMLYTCYLRHVIWPCYIYAIWLCYIPVIWLCYR